MYSTVIGIAGGSGSGKTTVAEKVYDSIKDLTSVVVIKLDDYYKDLTHLSFEERTKVNFDHPDSLDFDLLVEDVRKLKNGHAIDKPTYDFVSHNRSSLREIIEPVQIVIVEGILALSDERLRELFDIKIFVDTPDDIRFIRRLRRDNIQRGRSTESVINQYLATVRPMHHQFVEPSKRYADIIIPSGGENPVAISIITSKISSIINENCAIISNVLE